MVMMIMVIAMIMMRANLVCPTMPANSLLLFTAAETKMIIS